MGALGWLALIEAHSATYVGAVGGEAVRIELDDAGHGVATWLASGDSSTLTGRCRARCGFEVHGVGAHADAWWSWPSRPGPVAGEARQGGGTPIPIELVSGPDALWVGSMRIPRPGHEPGDHGSTPNLIVPLLLVADPVVQGRLDALMDPFELGAERWLNASPFEVAGRAVLVWEQAGLVEFEVWTTHDGPIGGGGPERHLVDLHTGEAVDREVFSEAGRAYLVERWPLGGGAMGDHPVSLLGEAPRRPVPELVSCRPTPDGLEVTAVWGAPGPLGAPGVSAVLPWRQIDNLLTSETPLRRLSAQR